MNTAVYRIEDGDTAYFLKLRKGFFDEISVALPKYLSDQGIRQIIPPLAGRAGQLWGRLESYKTILYPFIEGNNAYEAHLLDRHWDDLGKALKAIHTAEMPPALTNHIRRETYAPHGRSTVKKFLEGIEYGVIDDPVAKKVAAFLMSKRTEVLDLVRRAETLAQALQAQLVDQVVCHSDIHAGNILIGSNGVLYIVDWDEPILAPKERDLMFIGGGLLASGLTPEEEETSFYRSYGQVQINPTAMAYYRYERIIQDIAAYCEQLLLTDEGGEDREQSLRYLMSNFLPGGTIEIACTSEQTLR